MVLHIICLFCMSFKCKLNVMINLPCFLLESATFCFMSNPRSSSFASTSPFYVRFLQCWFGWSFSTLPSRSLVALMVNDALTARRKQKECASNFLKPTTLFLSLATGRWFEFCLFQISLGLFCGRFYIKIQVCIGRMRSGCELFCRLTVD